MRVLRHLASQQPDIHQVQRKARWHLFRGIPRLQVMSKKWSEPHREARLRFHLQAPFNGDGRGLTKPGPDADQNTPEPDPV